jgi:hypothetical protein
MNRLLLSRRNALVIVVSVLSGFMCFCFHAYAQESLICADDIEHYCKEIKPGGGRLLNCLKSHETDLSVSCKGKIDELRGIIKEFEQVCSGDITQFCKEVQPGGGRIIKCLKEREKELSPPCSAKIEMIGKRFQRKGE